ncbi:DUF6527 family protein [Mesorhizobium sp. Cs1299R1N3]|uniref:DUF6527 family protein n=1 Tax=Mesorhizobium sp. Cs1299R1N3 TaxID=3015173 RepID=UPI00301D5EED
MKIPAREIRFRAEVEHRHDGDPLLREPGDVVLVHRGRPRSLLIACPDGCGGSLSINLDQRAGKAWRLYRKGNAISLSPSVWREGGCESHFIVWQNRIIWCHRFEMGNQEPAYDVTLEAEVLAALDTVRFRPTLEIAEELNEIPWDVARAARKLVDGGLAEYPADAQRDRLRKRPMQESKPEKPRKGGFLDWMRRLLLGETK